MQKAQELGNINAGCLGEIRTYTYCCPIIIEVKEEERSLILLGEVSICESCAPFHSAQSVITVEGNVEIKSIQRYGRKIPLLEL